MTTTTALILNSSLIAGLLLAVALVMYIGHRAADSSARPAHELERLPAPESSRELDTAA